MEDIIQWTLLVLFGLALNGWIYFVYDYLNETKGRIGIIVKVLSIVPYSYGVIILVTLLACLLGLVILGICSCFYETFKGIKLLVKRESDN